MAIKSDRERESRISFSRSDALKCHFVVMVFCRLAEKCVERTIEQSCTKLHRRFQFGYFCYLVYQYVFLMLELFRIVQQTNMYVKRGVWIKELTCRKSLTNFIT